MFEKTGMGKPCKKKLELLLSFTIKAIPLKIFGIWGAGKITFFQKRYLPRKAVLQQPFNSGTDQIP